MKNHPPHKFFNPEKFRNKYRIKSTRLPNYDYSANGGYFVTICVKNRKHLFGEIKDGQLIETAQSKTCLGCWLDLPNHYQNCILDEFVIMPNHAHGIILIKNQVETGFKPVDRKPASNKIFLVGNNPRIQNMRRQKNKQMPKNPRSTILAI